jgi:hypothetical protein
VAAPKRIAPPWSLSLSVSTAVAGAPSIPGLVGGTDSARLMVRGPSTTVSFSSGTVQVTIRLPATKVSVVFTAR